MTEDTPSSVVVAVVLLRLIWIDTAWWHRHSLTRSALSGAGPGQGWTINREVFLPGEVSSFGSSVPPFSEPQLEWRGVRNKFSRDCEIWAAASEVLKFDELRDERGCIARATLLYICARQN